MGGLHAFVNFTSNNSTTFSQWILEKNRRLSLAGEEENCHFEIRQSTLLNRVSAHRRNYLTGALPAGVLLDLGEEEYATPAAFNHSIPLKRKGLENEKPV